MPLACVVYFMSKLLIFSACYDCKNDVNNEESIWKWVGYRKSSSLSSCVIYRSLWILALTTNNHSQLYAILNPIQGRSNLSFTFAIFAIMAG